MAGVRSADDYGLQLQALLPQGAAWPRETEATLTDVLLAFADGMARADQRAGVALDEADPRTTSELLADWERVLNLPDPDVGPAATIDGRRASVVQRLTMQGGQSRAYFAAVAAALGFVIDITEYRPYRAGLSGAGQGLSNGGWRFTWLVTAYVSAAVPAGGFSAQTLMAVLRRGRPAHTKVLFQFVDPAAIAFEFNFLT